MAETASHKLHERAEGLSQNLPPLLVKAERLAATVMLGVHGRKRAGPGENFWAFRHYSFGDSTQRIDWHKSSKSDSVFIREKEWEAANTLWLWVNLGLRMNYKSHLASTTKKEQAQILALALASLATRAHERIGVLGSLTRAGTGQLAVRQMADHMRRTNDDPLPQPTALQRRSAAVLISDFLDEPEDVKRALAPLAASGVRGHLIQITDPAEETLPFNGRVEFLGLDVPDRYLTPKTQNLRARYIEAFAAQRANLRQIASRLGWSFTVHHTDQPLSPTLQALHHRISDR
ncbi:MAG: DUF58 domain-containing protein [Alphaproteobacteria bacterium]|nr:DUF58 domain-containing protein [Alphaproteobacteria bacterium]